MEVLADEKSGALILDVFGSFFYLSELPLGMPCRLSCVEGVPNYLLRSSWPLSA